MAEVVKSDKSIVMYIGCPKIIMCEWMSLTRNDSTETYNEKLILSFEFRKSVKRKENNLLWLHEVFVIIWWR